MKNIKTNIKKTSLAVVATLASVAVVAPSALAAGGIQGGLDAVGDGDGLAQGTLDGDIFGTIVNTILFIVGALSVIMLIYGGIQYSTSAGDSAKVTKAKNTVMYAIVGLIVAILSLAIVNFVVNQID